MTPSLPPIPRPSQDRRVAEIPAYGSNMHRCFETLTPSELMRLTIPDGGTVGEAIEMNAERVARTQLARELKTDSPEQTANWTCYYGPITWNHSMPSIAVVLFPPGVKPNLKPA